MNILLINTQTIPSSGVGAASVNRILSYSKGLIKDGHSVRILSTSIGIDEWQIFEGIPVKHLGNKHIWLLFNYIITAIKLLKSVFELQKDCVLLVTHNYILTILMGLFCKIIKTKLIVEVNEYPFALMTKNKLKKWTATIFINLAYRLPDGIIVISKPLLDYYGSIARRKCCMLEVPIIVDTKRFDINVNDISYLYGDYIAYCGNMGGNKDGILNLLEAFSIIERKGYPLKLLLIGGATRKNDYAKILSFNHKIKNKNVVFYGEANREEIPKLLKGARILALARPSSLQATGGFPTKLGEYLATGNPVVITSVGDIPRYLKNKENAFLVNPDDNYAFAEAICYVWDHYCEAKIVGENGKKLASTIFNGDYQSIRIAQYIEKIIS